VSKTSKLDDILHRIEHSALKITLTVLFLAWVCAHAWADLKNIVVHVSEQKANMIESPRAEGCSDASRTRRTPP
jgi:hypothetical protein